jgi:chlorophyllide a reductase subunit Z
MDRIDPTPVRPAEHWEPEARALLEQHLETEPFLLRISAAKRLRDRAERDAREASEQGVTAERVARMLADLVEGRVA